MGALRRSRSVGPVPRGGVLTDPPPGAGREGRQPNPGRREGVATPHCGYRQGEGAGGPRGRV